MSSTDESAGMADTDINSTDPDGTNVPGHDDSGSAAAQGSGDDADRGNLDGSNPVAEPRDRSLDQAGSEGGGNGSFDDGAFIGRGVNTLAAFGADKLRLSDSGVVYVVANLNDGAGNDLNSSEGGGNGSFDEAAPESNGAESDAVDAGQDNGLNE